jgi:SAM-dependent methyltransferase
MLRYVYDVMPADWRTALKKMLHATGHARHFLDPLRARHLAKTRKRFSVVEAKLERRLALAGIASLAGKRCMEFGCGLMPTELACFWLRGARELIGVDYNRIARFRYMALALREEPRLAGFRPAIIDYRAPFDMSTQHIPNVDFIHSESVLEHVAPNDVPAVLRNLRDCLSPGGVMVHSIDLRDHDDLANNPHGFLDDPAYDSRRDHDARGNAIRKSAWISLFSATGMKIESHPEQATPGRPLPSEVDDDRLALFVVIVAKR